MGNAKRFRCFLASLVSPFGSGCLPGQPHQNKGQWLKPEGKEPAEAQKPPNFTAYAFSSNVNSFFDAVALGCLPLVLVFSLVVPYIADLSIAG
jgi:hypothetical protein